ncbi:hypothetical protein EDD86DRAFT_245891 [Gorgonomyces haynaldii]|nr:hypothetical protein EDD86DRAFT_245891 [Gorgonomyces haynaldii]
MSNNYGRPHQRPISLPPVSHVDAYSHYPPDPRRYDYHRMYHQPPPPYGHRPYRRPLEHQPLPPPPIAPPVTVKREERPPEPAPVPEPVRKLPPPVQPPPEPEKPKEQPKEEPIPEKEPTPEPEPPVEESHIEIRQREILEAKLKHYRAELADIQSGTHPDYILGLQMFERFRDEALKGAELIPAGRAERAGLREQMLQQLEEKRKRLQDDQENLDFSGGVEGSVADEARPSTRKTARLQTVRQVESRRTGKQGKQEKAPVLPFLLRDHEIYDDLGAGVPNARSMAGKRQKFI